MTTTSAFAARLLLPFTAAATLVLIAQLTRALLVPAPSLDIRGGELLALHFDHVQCRPTTLLSASDYADKWSTHPDDGGRAIRCVSDQLPLGDWPWLMVRYAGDPRDAAVRAGLDLDEDGTIDVPVTLGGAARHGWLMSVVPLPPAARQKIAKLVIEDDSTRPGGWLVIRDMVQFAGTAEGLSGAEAWPRGWAALTAVLLAAGVFWMARRETMAPAIVGIAALLAVQFLQTSSFYLRDEYVLMAGYTDGIQWPELVSYYDQFMPLWLGISAAGIALSGAWYAPLQLAMLAGHLAVVVLLLRLLDRHEVPRGLALGLGLLFATAWTHIDVVPWFIEGCFLLSTGLTLLALERTAAHVQGRRGALLQALVAAALAPLAFVGGVVAPGLCLAYVLLFARHDRVAAIWFGVIGIAFVALILLTTTALDSTRAVAGSASVADMLRFIARGTIASSLASLLALRDHGWLAAFGLLAIGAVAVAGSGTRLVSTWNLRLIAFGIAWMAAAYALQAVSRANTVYGDAMTLRYTYFGMTGAAFAVAAWLQPLARSWKPRWDSLRRALAAAGIAGCLAAVAANNVAFLARSDAHEREYFDINRQYFAVTRAAFAWTERTQAAAAPAGLVPKTIYPFVPDTTPQALTEQYRAIVCDLASCTGHEGTPPGAVPQAVWDALLFP